MSKGSEEKEHQFDQECQYCGKWYRKRGIDSHESNCPENPANQETEESDIMPEENESEESESKEIEELTCPSCGNVDNDTSPKIYWASEILEEYESELSKENVKILSQKDMYCADCNSAFNEGE